MGVKEAIILTAILIITSTERDAINRKLASDYPRPFVITKEVVTNLCPNSLATEASVYTMEGLDSEVTLCNE